MGESFAIRAIFARYGWLCLGAGLVLLAVLLLLRVFSWLIDWKAPFDPLDFMYLGAGLIVVVVSLGPYVATVGQLAGVAKVKTGLRTGPPASPRRKMIFYGLLAVVGLAFLGGIIWSRSFMVWLAFGSLLTVMGLTLLYLAWRIGRIERAAKITIYQTDPVWRFDRFNYVGVIKKL
jgi:hypothetical protein